MYTVLSRLDYCNALIAGSLQALLDKTSKSDQLFSSPHLQSHEICPHRSCSLRSSLATNQEPDAIQNSSHLLPHCLWYGLSIPLSVAPASDWEMVLANGAFYL